MASSVPSEVEHTLQRLSQHRGVRGVMILSNDTGRVIQHTGAMLEGPPGEAEHSSTGMANHSVDHDTRGESTPSSAGLNGESAPPVLNATVRKYSEAVRQIVASSKSAVEGLDDSDKVRFLRMRTGRYEMMITPEDKYTLVVFHDPNSQ